MAKKKIETGAAARRVVAVIEFVASSPQPASLSDVIRALALPKPTAHRILTLLERDHLLMRELGGKRYVAGPRLARLAVKTLENSTQRGLRHAILQALVNDIRETCNITILDGNELVYLDRVEADWSLRITLQPGSRVPLHCTASGKLFLSLMPVAQSKCLITVAPLKRFTDNTITNPERLAKELARIRSEMVGVDDEEFLTGLIALALPVLNKAGRICATVAVHAPTARMTLDQARQHLPALKRAARALSATIVFETA